MSISFGPVPSRRLGRSLGVNNIPYKVCTYACVYCQIGRTLRMEITRKEFYDPQIIYEDVRKKVEEVEKLGKKIDYITFVPDGEPTLDINLEREIELLKSLNYPVAILTNSSLIWDENVRNALLDLDYVSLKIDAVSERLWKRIDRPHKSLSLEKILKGIQDFSDEYGGKLVTETMLIGDIDYSEELEKIGEFLRTIGPDIAYIAIPTRPPTEKWVRVPEEELIARAYHKFSSRVSRVEYLIGYEGMEFVSTGDVKDDILSITAVHPMREDALRELLNRVNASWSVVEELIRNGELKRVEYGENIYYLRKFGKKGK